MLEIERNELITQISVQAMTILMFTSSEPEFELPEPKRMDDLDSFSVVQLILTLEDIYDVRLLEDMHAFEGETFDDLADFVALRISQNGQAAPSA